MSAKNAKDFYAMNAAAMAEAEVRSLLKGWVQREAKRTGSDMWAYHDAGQSIGRSGSWVRMWLAGDPRYTLNFVVSENIKRLCEHIEAGNEKMRRAENATAGEGSSGMSEITDSAAFLPPNDY